MGCLPQVPARFVLLEAPPIKLAQLTTASATLAALAPMAHTMAAHASPAHLVLAVTTLAQPWRLLARSAALAPFLQDRALHPASFAPWAPTPPTLALPLQAAVYPVLLATRKCALARPVSSARLELFSPMLWEHQLVMPQPPVHPAHPTHTAQLLVPRLWMTAGLAPAAAPRSLDPMP